MPEAPAEDAEEIRLLVESLREAIRQRADSDIEKVTGQLDDLVFYLADA